MASRYIPDGQSVHTASRCFPLKRGLRSIRNLPLIGRIDPAAHHARERQRLRALYWGMQLALGALLPLAFWRLGADNFPAAVSLIVLLGFIFFTDMEAFIIPDHGSLGGTIIGLMFAVLEIPGLPNLRQALLGGLCGFALIFSINALYHLWRGRDGMGFGDVKLMAMLGVWLGAESLLPILFVASMAGVVFGYAMTLAGAKHLGLGLVKVPFGCFLAIASIAWLLMLRFYINTGGAFLRHLSSEQLYIW